MSRTQHTRVRRTSAALGVAAVISAVGLTPTAAFAHDGGGDTPTATRGAMVAESGTGKAMTWVANLQYQRPGQLDGDFAQEGSDIEFIKTRTREYALAGTTSNGLQIVDITDPKEPVLAMVYDCKIYQGDVQVWKKDGRAYASYTADSKLGAEGAASECAQEMAGTFAQLGIAAKDAIGTFIVDITDPLNPTTVSYLHIARGSHNMTIHPSGDYLYNSNSDLITSTQPSIEVWDVSDPAAPVRATTLALPFTPTSLGSESHDITFNASGTRAYSAALSQTLVLDTTDPASPTIVSTIIDPTINVSHQADPVTVTAPDGTTHDLIIVTDEIAGATETFSCPGGGLHVYDVTGSNELAPVKVGSWFIPVVSAASTTRCTSHVLRIYPKQQLMTIAWYGQGVRVIDLSGLGQAASEALPVVGGLPALGTGTGMVEVGHYVMPDADTWSFKTNKIKKDGSFYGFGNDLTRGFDVYHYDGSTIGDVEPLLPVPLLTEAQLLAAGVPDVSALPLQPSTASTTWLLAMSPVTVGLLVALHAARRRRAQSTTGHAAGFS